MPREAQLKDVAVDLRELRVVVDKVEAMHRRVPEQVVVPALLSHLWYRVRVPPQDPDLPTTEVVRTRSD